jgi:hypothetical protein
MAKSSGGKRPARKTKQGSANVPGTYLGFSLQATRFLMRLLQAEPGDVVCLEVFDDVGVERPDGSRVAEQDKSNQTYNALADRAVDFWKTMANWVKAVLAGELDVNKTYFEIFTSKRASGPIADSFRNAETLDQAMKAIESAHQALLGQSNKNGKPSLGEAVKPHATSFFASDRRVTSTIVAHFTYRSGQGDSIDDLKAALMRKIVSEENCDDVLRWCIGWIKTQTDRLLEVGSPARVHEDVFHCALRNYVRVHDRLVILRSVAGTVCVSSLMPEDDMLTYVKQLRLIDVDDEDVLAAVNDYLRAAADRTFWSVQGLIDEVSLSKYCDELCRTWRNKKSKISITHADKTEIHQGKLLYLDCLEHSLPLDDCSTQPHFVRGSWHALSEDQSIGWHPRYKEELSKPETDDDGRRRAQR